MKLVNNMLSPIIMNSEDIIINQGLKIDEIDFAKNIRRQKLDIINHKLSPSQIKSIRPEIVDSWLRCHDKGLDIFDFGERPALDEYALGELLSDNEFLIKAAANSIYQFEDLLNNNYVVHLCDKNGVNLLVTGAHNMIKDLEYYNLVPGTIWDEETMGTASFSLCLRLGKPFQVTGPEHYFERIDTVTGCSAPIFDLHNNLAGVLTIGSVNWKFIHAQTLGLAVSIAELIQKEFQLALYKEMLHGIQEASQEAFLTVNHNGVITQVNGMAEKLIKNKDGQKLIGMPIESLLGRQPLISSVQATGKPLYDINIVINKFDQKLQLSSIYPMTTLHEKNFGYLLALKAMNFEEKDDPKPTSSENSFSFDNIVGSSPQILNSLKLAKKFSRLDSNVLLLGENGTGKEMFAQAIYNESRPYGPFIALNCGAIPKTLAESELFGYEGGSFTGAERRGKKGKIEQANGGILFLDEIGDLPLELQPALLRVLQEKKVWRIGGSKPIPVDYRLIAATNKDLLQLVKDGKFREDLYYRLAVFKISIPPLRERGSDILQLVKYFIADIAKKQQIPEPRLNNDAKYILLQYRWPGNVRQLENAILYAVCMAEDGVIKPADLPEEILERNVGSNLEYEDTQSNFYVEPKTAEAKAPKKAEKSAIAQALMQTEYNVSQAARILGVSRSTLCRKMKKYQL